MKFSSGTSMTLNKTANSTVTGLVYKTGVSTTGTLGVMFAQSRYGTGKVAFIGDSSPPDDGTGDTNDQLYNGWSAEVNGDHSRILTNATIWLASNTLREGDDLGAHSLNVWPNPASGDVQFQYHSASSDISILIQVVDVTGKRVYSIEKQVVEGANQFQIPASDFPSGMYFLLVNDNREQLLSRFIRQ
jgi:hypothetical protein